MEMSKNKDEEIKKGRHILIFLILIVVGVFGYMYYNSKLKVSEIPEPQIPEITQEPLNNNVTKDDLVGFWMYNIIKEDNLNFVGFWFYKDGSFSSDVKSVVKRPIGMREAATTRANDFNLQRIQGKWDLKGGRLVLVVNKMDDEEVNPPQRLVLDLGNLEKNPDGVFGTLSLKIDGVEYQRASHNPENPFSKD